MKTDNHFKINVRLFQYISGNNSLMAVLAGWKERIDYKNRCMEQAFYYPIV